MYQMLRGSISCHAHLFKLVELLTYFTIKLRKVHSETTTKQILIKWLCSSEGEMTRLKEGSDHLVDELDSVVMFFVLTNTYNTENKFNLYGLKNPEEIKKEILYIINEYWLPF